MPLSAEQREYVSVLEAIAGYAQAMVVIRHPDLLVMPDGRTRLLWRTDADEDSLSVAAG